MFMNNPLTILIAINGATLLSVVTIGFRVARHLGKVEAMFDLMWADYAHRKQLSQGKE